MQTVTIERDSARRASAPCCPAWTVSSRRCCDARSHTGWTTSKAPP